jgi:hypothetical protein
MTSPCTHITICCPTCCYEFQTWWRASINLTLGEEFSDEYLTELSSKMCPRCGQKISLDVLTVGKDNVWRIGPAEPAGASAKRKGEALSPTKRRPKRPATVRKPRIEPLLEFLPKLEAPGFVPGRWWRRRHGLPDLSSWPYGFERSDLIPWDPPPGFVLREWVRDIDPDTCPQFRFSPEVEAFLIALHTNGWIIDFDWPSWEAQAQRYAQPGNLESADVETIRKLLTTHVRKDLVDEGHLRDAFRDGHMLAILRRLKVIASGLPKDER